MLKITAIGLKYFVIFLGGIFLSFPISVMCGAIAIFFTTLVTSSGLRLLNLQGEKQNPSSAKLMVSPKNMDSCDRIDLPVRVQDSLL